MLYYSINSRRGSKISSTAITKLLKLGKWSSIFVSAANLLCSIISDTQQRQKTWWTQAYIDILEGNIRAVRYTIVQNTTEYPKVWRVFEYIYW